MIGASNLHSDWMSIYETYHAKMEMDRAAGKPITDDLETFRKVLGAFFHDWKSVKNIFSRLAPPKVVR